jgi:hypothetical protein
MKRNHFLQALAPDVEILLEKSPVTSKLWQVARELDFFFTLQGRPRQRIRSSLKATRSQVLSSTDPWAEIQYQSLYLTDDTKDRIVLHEPASDDPTVGIMVLKAARLRGESGLVYCGKEEQLKSFASKLAEYEERGADLNEKDFLSCLKEAAEAEGLKVIFERLSPEHGGEAEMEDWED